MYPFGDVKCVDRSPRDYNQLEVNLPESESTDSCSVNRSEAKVKGVSTGTSSDACLNLQGPGVMKKLGTRSQMS